MKQISRPQSLTAITIERLRTAIIEGDFGLGESLSENYLAEALGVSKTPVREALSQLRTEGLIKIAPQKGTFVFSLDVAELGQLCEFRYEFEAAAFRFAFARNRKPFLAGLQDVVGKMMNAIEHQSIREYLRLDTEFHQQAFRHCNDRYLADAIN